MPKPVVVEPVVCAVDPHPVVLALPKPVAAGLEPNPVFVAVPAPNPVGLLPNPVVLLAPKPVPVVRLPNVEAVEAPAALFQLDPPAPRPKVEPVFCPIVDLVPKVLADEA